MSNLNSYIDRCIIEDYATKSILDGYSLDVHDLPKHEMSNLVDQILESDTSIKEMLLEQIQEIINKRIPIVEAYTIADCKMERAI